MAVDQLIIFPTLISPTLLFASSVYIREERKIFGPDVPAILAKSIGDPNRPSPALDGLTHTHTLRFNGHFSR